MMAKRGTTKRDSTDQEDHIAKVYGGRRSPASGAKDYDLGDVRTEEFLFECKQTGNPLKPAQSISVKVSDLEKIREEALMNNRMPVLACRIHNPNSPLANRNGEIDLVVRLVTDDIMLLEKE